MVEDAKLDVPAPWARPGSGFTAAFEALALALCRELPVRQAMNLAALWRLPLPARPSRWPTSMRFVLMDAVVQEATR